MRKTSILPDRDNLDFKIVETSEQRSSLYDPVKQGILGVLITGCEDYSSEIKKEQRTLEDGTRITEEIKVEKPIRRHWMTVPEILKKLRETNPGLSLATTKAYYHLGKLHEQGLIEQFPETVSKKKKRVRGRYFRITAKFLVEVTVEASVGHSGTAVMPAEIGPRFVELAGMVRQSGVSASMKYQVNLDGALLWVSLTMSRHPDGLNIMAVVRDITTHQTLEERLEKSEVEFGRVIEDSIQGYAIYQEGLPVFINPAYAAIVGRTQNELELMNPEEVRKMIHPEDRHFFEERNKNIGLGVDTFPKQRFRYIRPDGSVRWVESFARKTEYLGRPALLALEIDITDQKIAEESLEQSERRFREIFDSSPVAIARCNLEGRFIEMNPKYTEVFGLHSIEDTTEYRLGNDPHFPQWAMNQLSEGNSVTFDLTYDFSLIQRRGFYKTSKQGTLDLIASLAPLGIPKDDPEAGYLVMVQDITERLKAEEALRDSEERYRAFFEQAADSIVVFDPHTMRIIDFNRPAHERLGYTPDEFDKLHIWEIDASGNKTMVETRIMEIAEKGSLVFETRHKTKDGEIIDVRISSKVVSFRDRLTIQWIITDVTEQKKIDKILKESEERYKALFNTSINAILILKDNKLVDVNPSALKIFGYSYDAIIGKTLWALSPRRQPDGSLSKESLMQKINLALSREPQLFNWIYRRDDGSDFDSFVSVSALHLEGEDLVQIVLRLETEEHLLLVGGYTDE
ncbi:MAG: PAS domain S-box protein [Candidatus Thorarchaeota archaeon]